MLKSFNEFGEFKFVLKSFNEFGEFKFMLKSFNEFGEFYAVCPLSHTLQIGCSFHCYISGEENLWVVRVDMTDFIPQTHFHHGHTAITVSSM